MKYKITMTWLLPKSESVGAPRSKVPSGRPTEVRRTARPLSPSANQISITYPSNTFACLEEMLIDNDPNNQLLW